jgi:hypothetical protein
MKIGIDARVLLHKKQDMKINLSMNGLNEITYLK